MCSGAMCETKREPYPVGISHRTLRQDPPGQGSFWQPPKVAAKPMGRRE
jgi:hypothetical protein